MRMKICNFNPLIIIQMMITSLLVGSLSTASRHLEAQPHQNLTTDTLLTEKSYFAKLQVADEAVFKDEFETCFLMILSQTMRTYYQNLPGMDERKAYMHYYWTASNPNPIQPENDWLLEFNRRVSYARKNYPDSRPPYVDDRGKIYIKLGKPQRQYSDPGGEQFADFFNRESIRNFYRVKYPYVSYSVEASETWSYENVTDGLTFYFRRDGRVYRRLNDLKKLIVDGKRVQQISAPGMSVEPNWEEWLWADMIKKRAGISPSLSRAAGKIINMEETIRLAVEGEGRSAGIFNDVLAKPLSVLSEYEREHSFEIKSAQRAAPVTAYDPIQAENKLKFMDRISQFRGPNKKTRLEIALLAPLKKNIVKKVKKSSKEKLEVACDAMIRNQSFRPLMRSSGKINIAVGKAARAKFENVVGRVELLLPPQNVELTLQMKELDKKKTGFSRKMIAVRDLSGDSLLISDVSFYQQHDAKKFGSIVEPFHRQNLLVIPYPWQKLKRSKPPLFYFEIYNLKTAGIKDKIQISYTITPIRENANILKSLGNALSKDSKPSVSTTYIREIASDSMQELIEINLKNVKKGNHKLEITAASTGNPDISATLTSIIQVEK